MPLDATLIGTASEPHTFEVEQGAIVKLADAIGDPQPAYREGVAAPPTFPTTFRFAIPGLADVDPARFLHGEQAVRRLKVRFGAMVKPGDELTCRGVVREVRDGLAVLDVWAENQRGEKVTTGEAEVENG